MCSEMSNRMVGVARPRYAFSKLNEIDDDDEWKVHRTLEN